MIWLRIAILGLIVCNLQVMPRAVHAAAENAETSAAQRRPSRRERQGVEAGFDRGLFSTKDRPVSGADGHRHQGSPHLSKAEMVAKIA